MLVGVVWTVSKAKKTVAEVYLAVYGDTEGLPLASALRSCVLFPNFRTLPLLRLR